MDVAAQTDGTPLPCHARLILAKNRATANAPANPQASLPAIPHRARMHAQRGMSGRFADMRL